MHTKRLVPRVARAVAASLAAAAFVTAVAFAQSSLTMETHAAFFSRETHQAKVLDPQMFVKAPGAPAGVGPQKIAHVAGVRNALVSDASSTEAYNADGKDLGFTLGTWFGAKGSVEISDEGSAHPRVAATFSQLIPNGVYSLFANHFAPGNITFAPLDGTGTGNSFTANSNGTATISVNASGPLTHANGILLVYHSDGKTHGTKRGKPGVTAHHQLIVRIP
jgi:hypothetical protein